MMLPKLIFARWQVQLAPFDFEIQDKGKLEEKVVILAEGEDHPQVHQDHHTGSSSSSTPIIQKGGMSLYNLNSVSTRKSFIINTSGRYSVK
ncbi:hypothetical protein H5410_057584 [Solanum commersonii]|uniref:Uncharacterized protein n=1 Tax=Solanum commersonii TaxID=4109 RepID=A0A9J5WPE8_SOLCO|nr:hypothetical protein H5410_057584 [Solanum commersonii]